jgi:hypothetical protein
VRLLFGDISKSYRTNPFRKVVHYRPQKPSASGFSTGSPQSRQSQVPGRAAVVDPSSLLKSAHALRQARTRDFPFCERLYFAEMNHIITQLGLDMARQRESFARQWHVAEVRIITISGEDMLAADQDVRQYSLSRPALSFGTHAAPRHRHPGLQMLIEEAGRAGKPVTPWSAEDQPSARRLYERLG